VSAGSAGGWSGRPGIGVLSPVRRPHRIGWLPAVAVTALLCLPACSSDEGKLPSGAGLLRRAAASIREVQTGRFALEVRGQIGGLDVRRADGVMTWDGRASGTVDLEQGGQLVEFDVVFVRGTVYVKGPTGPFQAVPSELAGTIYDPTDLLDPSKGLTRVLATATRARTVGREEVEGTDSFKVLATLDGRVLGPLVPNPVPRSLPATLWIGAEEPQLLKTETSFPAGGGSGATHLALTVSDFDTPVEITPPPTS
jgi:lipoprotein LprG